MSENTPDNETLEDAIVAYVKERGGSTLRAKFFDVSDEEGRREYAGWLAQEIEDLNSFILHDYTGE